MVYTYSHLEEFVQGLYQDLNIYSPSELNLFKIADLLNISLYPISTGSQAIQFEGRHYIFLNNALTARERFEMFGHELGHILLHSGNQKNMNGNYRVYQEWKASLFAFHFCIPTFMLQKLTISSLDKYSTSELFGVTSEFAEKRLYLYQQKLMQFQYMKKLSS